VSQSYSYSYTTVTTVTVTGPPFAALSQLSARLHLFFNPGAGVNLK
jgi:hypothetical protein